jgi:hypothetical protein
MAERDSVLAPATQHTPSAGATPPAGVTPPAGAESQPAALERVLAAVRRRWGQGSIIRLDGETSTVQDLAGGKRGPGTRRTRAQRLKELPSWWPAGGAEAGHQSSWLPWARPRALELVGELGGGRLALTLAWVAAARPALAAVVDPGRGLLATGAADPPGEARIAPPAGWFYAPTAAMAGIDLQRLIVVRPPEEEPRAPLDAVAVLLRSEAFDVVLCPLPAYARISTTFAATLTTLAARAGTTLFLLTSPGARGLGAFAEYRIRLTAHRWMWEAGELAGLKLRVITERARAAAGMELGGAQAAPLEHELTLRLHRHHRDGPLDSQVAGRTPTAIPDRLVLAGASRRISPAEAASSDDTAGLWPVPLGDVG